MTDRAKGVQAWLDAIDAALGGVLASMEVRDALKAVREEIAAQQEAIDRANDVPDSAHLEDFIGWAEAGEHHFDALSLSYKHLAAHGELMERQYAKDPARARLMAVRNAEQFLVSADTWQQQECYEAANAMKRAAAWCKSFAEQA